MKIIKEIGWFILGMIISPFFIVGATIYHLWKMWIDPKYRKKDPSFYSQLKNPNLE